MKKYFFVMLFSFLLNSFSTAHAERIKTDTLSFIFEGKKLTGLLDQPIGRAPSGLVILVPGSGKTNMVLGNGYYRRLRYFFAEHGLSCFVWDKPGCGRSEGSYNGDPSIESSAMETIAAIDELKRLKIPGSNRIGLWGLSRGGWVCPMVIAKYPSIAFWISVSGPDSEDNTVYLLESNFRAEGRSEAHTQMLVSEWKKGNDLFRKGGSFEAYQEVTQNLRKDSFWITVSGDPYTEEGYERSQKNFMQENYPFNEATGLRIYVEHFDSILRKVNCPVLAIFGKNDSQVDWQKTSTLYEKTIGKDTLASLAIRVFPDCNHNIQKCTTGGMKEHLTSWEPCTGYFEAMLSWLKENEMLIE